MTRRSSRSVLSEPLLIGAVTLLVAVTAVFLSYGANNGLPGVPTTRLLLDTPTAGHLGKNAGVKLGGTLIGRVASMEAVPHAHGPATARLELKVDAQQKLPVDSTFRVRPVSNTGQDIVEVTRGHASRLLTDGMRIPARQVARDTVYLDEFFGTFTPRAREGIRQGVAGYAAGLAGRGASLNAALARLPKLLTDLAPAMRNLASPRTQLGPAIRGYAAAAAEAAPAAAEQAQGLRELDDTFDGFGRDPAALERAIVAGPGAADAVISSAPATRRLLASAGRLAAALRPAALATPRAATALLGMTNAARAGFPALEQALPRVDALTSDLAAFGTDPAALRGLQRLGDTGRAAARLLAFVTPAQTTCRYGSLLLRNLASTLGEGPTSGTAVRAVVVAINAVANGEAVLAAKPASGPDGVGVGHLHSNPYPNTAAPGQPRECEAGQEPFRAGRVVVGNVPGNQDAVTESERKP